MNRLSFASDCGICIRRSIFFILLTHTLTGAAANRSCSTNPLTSPSGTITSLYLSIDIDGRAAELLEWRNHLFYQKTAYRLEPLTPGSQALALFKGSLKGSLKGEPTQLERLAFVGWEGNGTQDPSQRIAWIEALDVRSGTLFESDIGYNNVTAKCSDHH